MGKSKDLASGAAYQDQTESDTRYVNTAGDTMTGALTVDTATSTNLTVDSGVYGGIQFKVAGTDTGYITSYTNGSGAEAMYIGGADTVNLHTGTNHALTGGTTRLQIDSSGRVTMPNQPSFSAYRDAGHVTGGNVYVFDHTHYNVGNMYNSSNGRATVPVAGKYLLTFWLMTNNDATYDNRYIRLRINNVSPAYKNIYSSSGGSVHHQFSWAGVISLSANDYVDIYVDNLNMYGVNGIYSNFSMQLLS